MSATKVVIVYSPNQYRKRCVYIPDRDSEVAQIVNTVKKHKGGKLGLFVGSRAVHDQIGPDAMLALATGHQPKDDVCNVHQGTQIVGQVHADPLLDFELLANGQHLSQ